MSNWEKYDDEAKEQKRIDVGFRINFISINNLLIQLDEQTGEWDEQYPKSELWKLMFTDFFMQALLLSLSHGIFMIITLPFLFFYLYVMTRIYKIWKRFQYKKSQFILAAFSGLMIVLGIAYVVHVYIFRS